jgi:5'(3')-deoxyribonucleotidase
MTSLRMPSLCIDVDNVIARTDELMRHVIRDFTGGRVNFDYEHIVEFDYRKCKDATGQTIAKNDWKKIHELFSDPCYLWKIQPWPGVQNHLKRLARSFDIHLATSRLAKARRTTIEWLEYHEFPPHGLHFVTSGDKHIYFGKCIAAIEDHYEQAVEFAKSGTPCFLLEHSWNRDKPKMKNLTWVKSWKDLTRQLLALPTNSCT